MQTRQPEMLTIEEPLALHRRRRLYHGHHETGRTLRKINAGKRPVDLERPRLACLRVEMVPVAQVKRHVAVLLNLEYYDVSARRANCPSLEKNGVAGLRGEPYELIHHRPFCECPPQILCSGMWLQASLNTAFRTHLEYDPCLGLRGLARRQQIRVRISGMHLD
jgi:hypothetical protein